MEDLKLQLKRKDRLAKYFDSVLVGFPVPFFTTDLQGYFLRVNDQLSGLVGQQPHQLIGMLVTNSFRLPNDWIEQVKLKGVQKFEGVSRAHGAWANVLKEDGKIIGYVVTLIEEKRVLFEPNW